MEQSEQTHCNNGAVPLGPPLVEVEPVTERPFHGFLLRHHAAFYFAPDACLLTDPSGVIEEANCNAALLFACRSEHLRGKPLAFLLAQECRSTFYAQLADLRRGFHLRDWRARLGSRAAPSTPVSVSAAPYVDDAGQWLGLRWTLRDISHQLWTEQALALERDFANTVVGLAPAIITVLDAAGHILRANPYLGAVVGLGEDELQGREWLLLFAEENRPAAQAALGESLIHARRANGTGRLLTRGGQARTVSWSVQRLGTESAGPPMLLVVGHDITELHQAQEQAVRSERLAAIGQVVASLAHESRNALQCSQACLERLGWRLEDQPEALDLITRARAGLANIALLFEEVRNYAGSIILDRAATRLSDVWREAWKQARAGFPDCKARLEERGDRNWWWSVDRQRLGQVFRNIFENAFAACAGEAHVEVICDDTTLASGPAVRMVVRDNGPGLSPEQRDRIFEPFYTTKPTGTGLGMAIAKRIVEAHGGSIIAGNGPGGGAEIVITISRSNS